MNSGGAFIGIPSVLPTTRPFNTHKHAHPRTPQAKKTITMPKTTKLDDPLRHFVCYKCSRKKPSPGPCKRRSHWPERRRFFEPSKAAACKGCSGAKCPRDCPHRPSTCTGFDSSLGCQRYRPSKIVPCKGWGWTTCLRNCPYRPGDGVREGLS